MAVQELATNVCTTMVDCVKGQRRRCVSMLVHVQIGTLLNHYAFFEIFLKCTDFNKVMKV